MDGDAMRLFASGEIRDREGRFFVTNQGLIPTHNQTNLQGRTKIRVDDDLFPSAVGEPQVRMRRGAFLLLVFSFGFFLFSTPLGFFHKHLRACSYRILFPSHSLGYFGVWSKYLVSFFKPFFYFSFLLGSVPGPLFTECEEWSRQREGPLHDFFSRAHAAQISV